MIAGVLVAGLMYGCGWGTLCSTDTCIVLSEPDTGTPPIGNQVRLDQYPPVVVSTSPASGSLGVDVALDRIEVTFSKPMQDQSWSWVDGGAPFPELGTVSYETETLHVADGVVLEPDVGYLAWLNSPYGTYTSFTDTEGRSALAWPLSFATSSDPAVLAAFPPAVVGTVPVAGTSDVDPTLDQIEVTFSKPMDPAFSSWTPDAPDTYPVVPASGFADGRTATLDVTLDPGTTYAIWINAADRPRFRDTDGNLAPPYLLTFRTAD